MPQHEVPDGLIFEIQFALAFNATRWPKKPRRDQGRIGMEDYLPLARLIVEHIVRSNWRVERGAPLPSHSTAGHMPQKPVEEG